MADVKWIKITTDIFDDEKIILIESMPSADSIIVIWFKLLALAGKQNNDGVFLMSNRIAYTDEMLSFIFRRDINTVRLALKAFEQFGMIEIVNNVITIPNWNKHQTLDSYEKKKERDRIYQAERRAKQRALITESSEESSDSKAIPSSDIAVSEEDKERDKEKDKDKNIMGDSNESPRKRYSRSPFHPPSVEEVKAYCDERKNTVDPEAFVDFYSSKDWMIGKNRMKDWKAAVRTWERSRTEKRQQTRKEIVPGWMSKPNKFHNYQQRNEDYDSLIDQNDPLMRTAANDDGIRERAEALKRQFAEGGNR